MAIALHLVAERTDHLAVTGVAPLADIDVASCLFERGIGPHAFDLLDRIIDPEQRGNLHNAADRDSGKGRRCQKGDVAFKALVAFGRFFNARCICDRFSHVRAFQFAAAGIAGRSASASYGVWVSMPSSRVLPAIVAHTL